MTLNEDELIAHFKEVAEAERLNSSSIRSCIVDETLCLCTDENLCNTCIMSCYLHSGQEWRRPTMNKNCKFHSRKNPKKCTILKDLYCRKDPEKPCKFYQPAAADEPPEKSMKRR